MSPRSSSNSSPSADIPRTPPSTSRNDEFTEMTIYSTFPLTMTSWRGEGRKTAVLSPPSPNFGLSKSCWKVLFLLEDFPPKPHKSPPSFLPIPVPGFVTYSRFHGIHSHTAVTIPFCFRLFLLVRLLSRFCNFSTVQIVSDSRSWFNFYLILISVGFPRDSHGIAGNPIALVVSGLSWCADARSDVLLINVVHWFCSLFSAGSFDL